MHWNYIREPKQCELNEADDEDNRLSLSLSNADELNELILSNVQDKNQKVAALTQLQASLSKLCFLNGSNNCFARSKLKLFVPEIFAKFLGR